MAQRAEDSRKNYDLIKNFHKTHDHIKGVDGIIEIDSDSDSYYDKDSDYIPRMVKREDSDGIYDGSEVDPYKNKDDVFIEEVNEGEETKSPCLGIWHRINTQTTTDYFPSWNNKYYPKGGPKEVNLAQI